MNIIVGCGGQKAPSARPAGEMYQGNYFVDVMRWARSIEGSRILIMSAKYGLIEEAQEIEPYDVRIDSVLGRVSFGTLGQQIRDLAIEPEPVTVAGASYRRFIFAASAGKIRPRNPFVDLGREVGFGAGLAKQKRLLRHFHGRMPSPEGFVVPEGWKPEQRRRPTRLS